MVPPRSAPRVVLFAFTLLFGSTAAWSPGGPTLVHEAQAAKKKKKKKPAAKKRKPAAKPAAAPAEKAEETAEAKEDDADEADAAEAPAAAETPAAAEPAAQADAPPPRRSRAQADAVVAEEEDDDDEPGSAGARTRSPVAPATAALLVAGSLAGRRFQYDAPLQSENAFPRPGVLLEIEAFPFSGSIRPLGLRASYAREGGEAVLRNPDDSEARQSVVHERWSVAAAWSLPLGDSVWLIPTTGFGRNRFEIAGAQRVAPSACRDTSGELCLASVRLLHVDAGATMRVALGATMGLELGAGGIAGLSMDAREGSLVSEQSARSLGFVASGGFRYALQPWLAATAGGSWTRMSHTFSSDTAGYSRATETFFGAHLGLVAALR